MTTVQNYRDGKLVELNRRPQAWASFHNGRVMISVYGYRTQTRSDIRV